MKIAVMGGNSTKLRPKVQLQGRKLITDGTLIRAEEGPKVLASPPRAYMAQGFFSFAIAVYTLGGYNWRHRGDFRISTKNTPKLSKLKKKLFNFFRGAGG